MCMSHTVDVTLLQHLAACQTVAVLTVLVRTDIGSSDTGDVLQVWVDYFRTLGTLSTSRRTGLARLSNAAAKLKAVLLPRF